MGKEYSKSIWLKPAGGYQSNTDRRYGRKHAYVSFRLSTSQLERISSQRKMPTEVLMHESAPNQTTKRSQSPFPSTPRSWDDSESSGSILSVVNENYSSTSRWKDTVNTDEDHSGRLAQRGRGESSYGYSELKYHPKEKTEARNDQKKPGKVSRPQQTVVDDDFWTLSDNYYKYCDKDSDSDKGWTAVLHQKSRSRKKNMFSSGKGWETLPGKEEHELKQPTMNASVNTTASASSNGSNYLENIQEPSLQEEPASLKGGIPWHQCNENDSSSEGDNDSNEFLQPGVFTLDGNNNLEDDSGVSEDLEVDWSLFDGFADGLGVAEAISYVDPQFLTYMALEECLVQAMETALAHLESLAVGMEVVNPPVSKESESIDTLPEILVTEDHNAVGQEMCCPICCSENVKGEVATELPCHHYFHKPCVSLWLKSGTCPVCPCSLPHCEDQSCLLLVCLFSPSEIHNTAGTLSKLSIEMKPVNY
ncbi:LOW QUALITY PROTEIN: E3 ubiquitin-protein ligase Praja-1 [Rhynchocyon petersi]